MQVPPKTIVIDGMTADWAGVAPILSDPSGDDTAPDEHGTDLARVYLARDSMWLYFLMTLHDGAPRTPSAANQHFHYSVDIMQHLYQISTPGDFNATAKKFFEEPYWHVEVAVRGPAGNPWVGWFTGPEYVAVAQNPWTRSSRPAGGGAGGCGSAIPATRDSGQAPGRVQPAVWFGASPAGRKLFGRLRRGGPFQTPCCSSAVFRGPFHHPSL